MHRVEVFLANCVDNVKKMWYTYNRRQNEFDVYYKAMY